MSPVSPPPARPPHPRGLGVAAIFGLLGVAAGAFGAHALRDQLGADALEIWKTGAHYQQVHAVIMAVAAFPAGASSQARRLSVAAFGVGIVIFAGTLYGLAVGGPRWLGAVTPLGGLSLMVGWAALALHARTALPAAANAAPDPHDR